MNGTDIIKQLDIKTKVRVDEIRLTPNMSKQFDRTFYVSCDGNDENNGLSPKTAWQTLSRINKADVDGELKYGDAILLKRGDTFRGTIKIKTDGITISAYSEGKKPVILSAPRNYADSSLWLETKYPNIYECCDKFNKINDVGFITFDNGKAYGIKDIITYDSNEGCTVHYIEKRLYNGFFDLNTDLHFFHDLRSGKLYLYSASGNPGTRFNSIELSLRVNAITVLANDVTVDNLCIKHTGSHGVGAIVVNRLSVTNCEFGWIGGSLQDYAYSQDGIPPAIRYGNAVEMWGGCDGYVVKNCLIYQVYDAGLTFQFCTGNENKDESSRNIIFADNVVLNCYYSIEYFLNIAGKNNPSIIENVLFENNLMRFASHGMCEQRPDTRAGTHIKAKHVHNCGINFVMRNNVFDESRNMLIIHNQDPLNENFNFELPKMQGNLYLQTPTAQFGTFSDFSRPQDSDCLISEHFGEKEIAFLRSIDKDCEAYIREEYDKSTENCFI